MDGIPFGMPVGFLFSAPPFRLCADGERGGIPQ